jgi:hypothetical protein
MLRKKFQSPIKGQYQQGDVWLQRVDTIPADAERVEGAVLAEGEGHHLHRFAPAMPDIQLYVKDGVRYARVGREAVIEHVTPDGRHGEHHPITLPAGDYKFGQVMEYDYLNEMAREVTD